MTMDRNWDSEIYVSQSLPKTFFKDLIEMKKNSNFVISTDYKWRKFEIPNN